MFTKLSPRFISLCLKGERTQILLKCAKYTTSKKKIPLKSALIYLPHFYQNFLNVLKSRHPDAAALCSMCSCDTASLSRLMHILWVQSQSTFQAELKISHNCADPWCWWVWLRSGFRLLWKITKYIYQKTVNLSF